jgi:Kdo2-lipid IVA lauroyltransferase/acyltransferase
MAAPSWKHRLEYALGRGAQIGVAALPQPLAERLGAGLGSLARWPLGIRRSTVRDNLRTAFPDASEAWIEETARAAFLHLGREAAAILRLSRLDAAAVRERTSAPNWDALVAALGERRGALLVTGHFGNWEVAAAGVAARGVPIEAVAKRLRNRLVDARIEEMRGRLGIATIEMSEAHRAVPRALMAGKVVGLVADQDAGGSGVWVPFFGRPASTHRGPAMFALRFGAPLFACATRRLPSGHYVATLDRIPVERTGDNEADVRRVTAALAAHLEQAVRAAPEQYFWFHKRWKTPPPLEP